MDPSDATSEGTETGSSSSRATSRSLLQRARTGDAPSWGKLVTLYAPLVYHWCRRRGLQETDAADIVQDVFHAVATHLALFDAEREGSTFRGWLKTITENKIRDHHRRRNDSLEPTGGTDALRRLSQVPAASALDSSTATPADEWDGGFFRRALDVVHQEFQEPTWQAFWRTAIDERSPADVGAELGMTAGAVRVAKCRVLKRLRETIEDLPA